VPHLERDHRTVCRSVVLRRGGLNVLLNIQSEQVPCSAGKRLGGKEVGS
jgi:hypothetical protein